MGWKMKKKQILIGALVLMLVPFTASAQYGLFNEHQQPIPSSIEDEILEMKGHCDLGYDPWDCFCQGFQ